MTKLRGLQFVQFLFCLSFVLSLLGCAAPLEIIPSASFLPSAAQVEREKALYAIPPELRARLKAVLAQSCRVAENERPDPRYMGQSQQDPLWELEKRLLLPLLKWGVDKTTEPTPEEKAAHLEARQILPLPPLVMEKVPVEEPPLLERDGVQLGGGFAYGAGIGFVPLGSNTVDVAIELRLLPKGTYLARVGRACGEILAGTGQIVFGGVGMSAGAGMCSTGGGAVPGVLISPNPWRLPPMVAKFYKNC